MDLKDLQALSQIKTVAEPVWWLGGILLVIGAFLLRLVTKYRKGSPRTLVKELSKRVDELQASFDKSFAEQQKHVSINAADVVDLTNQLQAIIADNVDKFADKADTQKELSGLLGRLQEMATRISVLDGRLFDVGFGGRRHDPRDRR